MADFGSKRVLIMATNGFEQSELFRPREALIDAGVTVTLAAPSSDPIQGMVHDEKGATITPDATIATVDAMDYDMLVLPGGVANPDTLRQDAGAVALIRAFAGLGKPIAAICHAPWLLIEAELVEGRRMTSWPSLRTDLANAGATVVDEEVVIDGPFITSRMPDDIPAFNDAVLAALEATGG